MGVFQKIETWFSRFQTLMWLWAVAGGAVIAIATALLNAPKWVIVVTSVGTACLIVGILNLSVWWSERKPKAVPEVQRSWVDLETSFREMIPALQFTNLAKQSGGSAGEHWRVAGPADTIARNRFEVLAEIAGRKLLSQIESTDPEELQNAPDNVTRWYRALWCFGGSTEFGLWAQETDQEGNLLGIITTGTINRPAEVSTLVCLKLQPRDTA